MKAEENKNEELDDGKDFKVEETEVKAKSNIASSFAAIKQKGMFLIVILLGVGAIYYIFNDDSSTEQKPDKPVSQNLSKDELESLSSKAVPVAKEVGLDEMQVSQKMPELPKLADPILPPVPINLPPVQQMRNAPAQLQVPVASMPVEAPKKAFTNKVNIASPMLVISGAVDSGNAQSQHHSMDVSSLTAQDLLDPKKFEEFKKALQGGNSNSNISEDAELQRSSGQIMATYKGNLDYIIGKGKMLDVVLENGINTELNGPLLGLVSRDIYSESGNVVLIPKGSKLIGSYSTSIAPSQSRVDVAWNIIAMPNGLDIQVNSLGTDQLGRGGVFGKVDPKFKALLLSSILVGGIQIGAGELTKKILGNTSVTSTNILPSPSNNNTASTVTTGDAVAMATSQALNNLSQSLTDFVKRYSNVTPVIRVPQGQRVKVFVQQDLIFPRSAFNPINID